MMVVTEEIVCLSIVYIKLGIIEKKIFIWIYFLIFHHLLKDAVVWHGGVCLVLGFGHEKHPSHAVSLAEGGGVAHPLEDVEGGVGPGVHQRVGCGEEFVIVARAHAGTEQDDNEAKDGEG